MDSIRVRMNEWFFTQGLVGLKKIFEKYGEEVQTTEDGIIIERKHLDLITDAFFHYYLDEYSVARRDEKKLRILHKKFKEGDQTAKKDLNSELNDIKKKVAKYFSDTVEGKKLIEVADLYRKEKKYRPEMNDWLNTFNNMLHTKEINEKLTANFFKTVHLTPHFGQVSFLNVVNNKKSIEEQKEIFYKDFVLPVKEELELIDSLAEENETRLKKVLENINSKHLTSLAKQLKKQKTIDSMKNYIHEEVHKCSLTDLPVALHPFEEGIFVPLALSIGKSINMTWDANGKEYFPISSLAKLIIFCSQAGATMSQGKSVFVYYSGLFDEVFKTNQFYGQQKSKNKTFDEIVFDLVREQQFRAKQLQKQYVIYEYESEYQAKKTLLNYMVMTPNLVKLFSEHYKLFDHIHYSLKGEFIHMLLRNIDTKCFINKVLRDKVKNLYSPFEVIRMVQIRHLNQLYAKGDFQVDSNLQKRYVWALVKSAEEVKQKINNEKKVQGIAYRLLNAVRSNDKNTFMDTVMRTYISYDLEMPGLLLEAFHEDKLDFATVGNAWVAGLISKSKKSGEGESQNE